LKNDKYSNTSDESEETIVDSIHSDRDKDHHHHQSITDNIDIDVRDMKNVSDGGNPLHESRILGFRNREIYNISIESDNLKDACICEFYTNEVVPFYAIFSRNQKEK
jgi:hypothetical protein